MEIEKRGKKGKERESNCNNDRKLRSSSLHHAASKLNSIRLRYSSIIRLIKKHDRVAQYYWKFEFPVGKRYIEYYRKKRCEYKQGENCSNEASYRDGWESLAKRRGISIGELADSWNVPLASSVITWLWVSSERCFWNSTATRFSSSPSIRIYTCAYVYINRYLCMQVHRHTYTYTNLRT